MKTGRNKDNHRQAMITDTAGLAITIQMKTGRNKDNHRQAMMTGHAGLAITTQMMTGTSEIEEVIQGQVTMIGSAAKTGALITIVTTRDGVIHTCQEGMLS